MGVKPVYAVLLALAASAVMFVVFQAAQSAFSPGHRFRLGKRNAAYALLHAGNVFAIFLIASSVVTECMRGESAKHDALWAVSFGALALLAFGVTARMGTHVLLKATLPDELARGNVAAGIAAGAHSLATGIIVAHAVVGTDLNTMGVAMVFFILAQASLHALVLLFRTLTPYDDSEEILGENVAAALSYAGATIALALIVARAVEGNFEGWLASLRGYVFALGYGLLLYPVRQVIVQGLLLGVRPSLRRGRLDEAIARERDVGVGALEGLAYVATAFLVLRAG